MLSQDAARGRASQMRLPILLVGTLSCLTMVARGGRDVPPEPWPTELGAAFELYYADEFLEVQRVCQQVGARSADPHLRREAAALAAMATMRLPGRDNRIDGRARLAQLAEEDASLLTRPECQLAYGIAQTALSETATALYHLNQAAEAFEAAGQTDRLGETLVALAEAWARHGEWELTIPEIDVSRPESRAEADRIRTARIRALRQRAAELPGCEDAVTRIDFLLARHLLASAGGSGEGLRLLEDLAGRAQITKTTAQACLLLGEQYETERRWTDAARLYARVHAADLGRLSEQAGERQRAIEQPHLMLDVPRQVDVGEQVEVRLTARNVTAVEFEVRRVELGGWLEQRQGRFSEPALPIAGALIAARDLTASSGAERGWWDSETLEEPLRFEAPAGAMVVLARARDDADNVLVVKRLVLAGDLRATVFYGGEHAAIWATHIGGPETVPDEAEPTARFWMYGSFVPTRPQFTGGTAVFALPPESRLLRDKRWVCLVQAGEQVALCHGRLEVARHVRDKPAVVLVGGPLEVRVGEQLHLFGRLLGGSLEVPANRFPRTIELQVLDTLDTLLDTITTPLSEADTFSTHLAITAGMASTNVRVVARLEGQVLENVFAPLNVRVLPVDATPLILTCRLPGWLPPTADTVGGQIEAAYPWGMAAANIRVGTRLKAVRLPCMEPRRAGWYPDTLGRILRLDSDGRGDSLQPLSDFNLPEGPVAYGLWAEAIGWDGRPSKTSSAEVLIGPEPVHLWLRGDAESVAVGEPFHVSVHWFDPTGRSTGLRPTLVVWRNGELRRQLDLLPTVSGLRSETWRPTAPGTYELIATLPQVAGEPLTAREIVQVTGGGEDDPPDVSPLRCEARIVQRDGRRHVRVQLGGKRREPLLLLFEAGDPFAARQLPSLDGSTELLVPLPGGAPADACLVLAICGEDGTRVVGVWPVQCGDDPALMLMPPACLNHPGPGDVVEVSVSCLRGGQPALDAVVMARLVNASKSGGVQWIPGEGRSDLLRLPGGVQFASSTTADSSVDGSDMILETRELSAQLAQAYLEDPTLWVEAQPVQDAPTTFPVPLPATPGLYHLMVAAQTRDGAFASRILDLDTRQVVQLSADVPAQLTLGDRTVASLTITNPEQTPLQARVTFDGGPGLQATEWRCIDQSTELSQSKSDAPVTLQLPSGRAVTLHARVEAGRAGSGTAAFLVETERGQRRVASSYHVLADADVSDVEAREAFSITRKLFLLESDSGSPDDGARPQMGPGDDRAPQWLRFELKSGERVAPGRLVLVQEEFSLDQPLPHIRWEQRLPTNCYTHVKEWSEFRHIGTRRELQLQALTHDAPQLEADTRHIHEYVMVAVRPGACLFPAPSVYSDEMPVRVEVRSAVERVIVTDSD